MEDNQYNVKHRISDFSFKEVAEHLKANFFKIGVRLTGLNEPSVEEINSVITELKKWHGNLPMDIFDHTFSLIAAGEIEVKEKKSFSSWYISQAIKAQKEKAFGKKKAYEPTMEDYWFHLLHTFKNTGRIETKRWDKVWDYCLHKGWLVSENETKKLTPFSERTSPSPNSLLLAEIEINQLVVDMYPSYYREGITNPKQ